MDYDDDGTLDMISGSYDPGDLYLFRGLGKGKFAKRQTLVDEAGVALVHHPVELVAYEKICAAGEDKMSQEAIKVRVASFGSWPTMADWDGDGDLDMLIGTFGGRMYRRENKGTRAEPIWDGESHEVMAGGESLHVPGKANPVAVDWDLDDRWDLVVSASDGSVQWYRNVGTATSPEFEAARPLIPASQEDAGPEPQPGTRSQLCVADYDRDGKPDLLVGDYRRVEDVKHSYVWLFRQL